MNQATVLAALQGDAPDSALAELAAGPRAIDCPDLGNGRLVFPRYREVRHLLRDPAFICAPTAAGMLSALPAELRELLAPVASWVLYADPPLHPRLRTLMAKAFSPRRITDLRSTIVRTADALVSEFATKGGGDAVTELAEPLPVRTISALLGIPEADQGVVKAWSDDVVLVAEPELTEDRQQLVALAWQRLARYFEGVVDERHARPGNDIISGLVQAEAQGDRLTTEEITANCIALLVGGHETTSSLMSSLFIAAAAHPEHREAVVIDDTFAAGFVEEVLRLDGPSKITARAAVYDTDVFGIPVVAGQRLVLLQASANRDPEVFAFAEEFRPERHPNPHLGFGHGPHACFGAALARMQATALLQAFMRESEALSIDRAGVRWRSSQVLRSAARMPVTSKRVLGGTA
ncbi:cytochrome P450 [Kitasatospora acidiphila]|uniref:Cytochrome P450 n=1 Tax=Kitasatospora acidiphila TaxID=2567942 RepID=A0A540WD54_9ACTN|nr:cytochrome P450 [Kitasatospora acidiphila]TQF06324.1 cytochrome P450 [Kitasatospora acidiphila]